MKAHRSVTFKTCGTWLSPVPKEGVDVSTEQNPLLQRVQDSYQRLSKVASNLNTASDNLGKIIQLLDQRLKGLNLGIVSWYKYVGDEDENGNYWGRHIGYAKIGTKWGIALSATSGNHHAPPGYDKDEEWLFNDAPRHLRIEAVGYIPEMMEALIKAAEEAAVKMKGKTSEAKQIADALATPPRPPAEPEITLE